MFYKMVNALQCDLMARLFVQYLAIYNNVDLNDNL